MSEYQYYEFRAIDRPLSQAEQFFAIDQELIAAAANAGGTLAGVEPRLEEWVGKLQPAERDGWLVRVARGEPQVGARLLHRLREVGAR